MKTIFLSLLLLSISGMMMAQVNEVVATSEIKSVKVFLLGAELSRSGKATFEKGTTRLVFKNLSPKTLPESIQFEAGENVKITNVESNIETINLNKVDSIALVKAQDSIEFAEKEIRRINSLVNTYQGEKELINMNKNIKNEAGGVTAVEIEKMADFYHRRMTVINAELFKLEEETSKWKEKISSYEQKIVKLCKPNIVQWFTVVVTIQAKQTVTAPYTLKYVAGGTGWSPMYDIRVQDVENKINMEYKAKVINQTGEDWTNVSMSFSTANPTMSQEAPSLEPWRLNFESNTDYEGRLNEFRPNNISRSEAQQRAGDIDLPEGVEFAEIELSLVDAEFRAEDEYTILSNGKPFTVNLNSHSLPVTYKYVAIPKVDESAFLVAEVTGWEDLNLLEGPTNIYFRGTFMGHSYIKPRYANDTLNISLGRDNKVLITRTKVEDKSSDKIIGTNNREEFVYKVTVRNTNPANVKFTLIDQVPISQEDDIKVEILDISSAEMDPYNGRLRWKFDLAPKEAKEFTVSFAVKYPKTKQVKIRTNKSVAKQRSVRFL